MRIPQRTSHGSILSWSQRRTSHCLGALVTDAPIPQRHGQIKPSDLGTWGWHAKKWNRDKVRRPAFSTGEISTHHHMLLENSATGFPWVFGVGSRKESGFWVCLLTTWGCLKRYLYVSQWRSIYCCKCCRPLKISPRQKISTHNKSYRAIISQKLSS